jgi:DNA-binding NtrC family response regulator
MDATERETRRALRETRDNVKAAAALLGISRQTLYNRLARYGIKLELTPERLALRSRLGGLAGGRGRPAA